MEDLYNSGSATPATTTSSGPASPTIADDRKHVVIVGLGMVAISFIEKLLKADPDHTLFSITVIGEEPHVAYNRVGLTSFFEHRKIEELYLNPKEWVCIYTLSLSDERSLTSYSTIRNHNCIITSQPG